MKTEILRPGILVALKTQLVGGVTYTRVDLETGKTEAELRAAADASGRPMPSVMRWETTRTIDDPEEHAAASKALSAARGLVARSCARTTYGLLCAEADEAALDAAVEAARKAVDEHNAGATSTRIGLYVLKGRIAGTDEQAARAIVADVRELIAAMDGGIARLDVEAIREAASRAAELGTMLAPEQRAAITGAVEAARKAARQIVKRVEKGGEQAAVVLADLQRGAIERARMSFLDLDTVEAPASEPVPAVDAARVAQLDLESMAAQDEAAMRAAGTWEAFVKRNDEEDRREAAAEAPVAAAVGEVQ